MTRMPLPAPCSLAEYKERVLCLCALHCASTTSGVRTGKRNARVGGAMTSKHQIKYGGWADDLVADDMSDAHRAEIASDARILGLWALDERDHIHLQGKAPG